MPSVTEEVVIPLPPERVQEYVADPATALVWQGNLQDYELLAAAPAAGAPARGVAQVMGKPVEWHAEITEWSPGRYGLRSTESPLDFDILWTFAPEGRGTRVTFRQESPSLGRFMDAIVVKMYQGQVRDNLDALRRALAGD